MSLMHRDVQPVKATAMLTTLAPERASSVLRWRLIRLIALTKN